MTMTKSSMTTRKLAGLGLFTALVVILQLLGSFIHFGPVSIQLVAPAVIVGSAIYGAGAGAWLGFVFSLTVLLTGGASLWLPLNPLGLFIMLFGKGILCGLAAGWTFALLQKKNETLAAAASAVVCPVVNTGVFILGNLAFFYPYILSWAKAAGFEGGALAYLIIVFAGVNFLVELAVDILLCPAILRLIQIGRKGRIR